MRLFSPLYARAMNWARHRHAPAYLGTMSFAESSFFPVPPDVMLAPMCLARPGRAWRLALHTTLASIIGRGARRLIAPWKDRNEEIEMKDTQSDGTPKSTPSATPNAYLGFRIAVGVIGLALLAIP